MFKFVNDREYDLVVYGATGFTGQYVVEEVARTAQKEDIKWAIGGRNADKLKSALTVAALKTGVDVKDVPVVVADNTDEASLRAMTARAQLIINLVGPYTMYGEPVVKACLETGTHYMDVGGETLFMEEMHLKYDRVAKEKRVYLISCCCLSADLWLPYVKRQFVGHVHSVETFTSIPDLKSSHISDGAWKTLIRGVVSRKEVAAVRQKLYKSGGDNKHDKFEEKLSSYFLVIKYNFRLC